MTLRSITGVDHVIVLTENLDAAATLYKRLGFLLTAPGQHRRGKSRNRTAVFDDNYIELLYYPPEQRRASGFLDQPSGAVAIGLQTPDSQGVHDELIALGHDVPDASEGGRPVELPGHGFFSARFVTQTFPEMMTGGLAALPSLFSCQHLTRDLIYRAEWRDHLNGATAITALHLVHPDPPLLAAGYAELFGPDGLTTHPKGFDFRLGRVTIAARTATAFRQSYPGIQPRESPSGWFAGLSLRVRRLRDTVAYLEDAKIPVISTAHGIAVGPEHTGGVVLVFQEA